MAETIKHRGPDDSGFYQKGPVGLAMTRLSIVDVEGGASPNTTNGKISGWFSTERSTTT